MSRRSSFFNDEAVKRFCKETESLGWYPESVIPEYQVVDGKYKVFKQQHLTTQVSTKQQLRSMMSSFGDSYERFIAQSIRDASGGKITERVVQQIARDMIQEVNELLVLDALDFVADSMINEAYQSIMEDMYRETVIKLIGEIHEEIKASDTMEEESIKLLASNLVGNVLRNARIQTEEKQEVDVDGLGYFNYQHGFGYGSQCTTTKCSHKDV
eukprot:6188501-Pleurochrysis_carterae.AAC.1